MPTKFRFLPSSFPFTSTKSNAANVSQVAVDEEPMVLDAAPSTELMENPESIGKSDEPSSMEGLHHIIKNTDQTFNWHLSLLEKFSLLQAQVHAQAGLPRQQVVAEEEVAIESVLRGRACELFLDWASRVRRKVQDSIQSSANRAGDGIVLMRHQLDELEAAAGQMTELRRQISAIKNEATDEEKTFEYLPLLGSFGFWLLLTILTLVDWVANLPIFGQLLPQEPGAEQRWAEIVAHNERFHALAGFANLGDRIAFAPEVSLFAFGVVVFLMFLAHVQGQSVRQLVAFWPRSEGQKVIGLQSHRRQAWFPALASATGILLVISFLFIARSHIKTAATERHEAALGQVQTLRVRLDDQTRAQSPEAAETSASLEEAKQSEHDLGVALNYASGISGMNGPITILNFVLALVAAAASYLHDKRHIGEARFSDPRIIPLEQKLEAVAAQSDAKRHLFRGTDSTIQTALAQARYLSSAFPLRDWPAKAERLNGVIPLFRAENARQRGIDVQNILAFQEDERLVLPDVRPNEPLINPPELQIYEREFAGLRDKIRIVDAAVSQAKMGSFA